jgi:hypothetical protein
MCQMGLVTYQMLQDQKLSLDCMAKSSMSGQIHGIQDLLVSSAIVTFTTVRPVKDFAIRARAASTSGPSGIPEEISNDDSTV